MSNRKPEITIYWRYDTLTDEHIKFSAWHFDIELQTFTNFLEHQNILAFYMSAFTSFLAKYYLLPPLGPGVWHFMHTALILLYIKMHYILENTSKYRGPTFRPWPSHFFFVYWMYSLICRKRVLFFRENEILEVS